MLHEIHGSGIDMWPYTTRETGFSPGWEGPLVPVFQPGLKVGELLLRVGDTNRDWRWLLVPVGITNRDEKSFSPERKKYRD